MIKSNFESYNDEAISLSFSFLPVIFHLLLLRRHVFRDAMRGQLRARRSEDGLVRRASARNSHQGFRDGERGRGRLLSHKGAVERRNQDSQLQVQILSILFPLLPSSFTQREKDFQSRMKILNDAV